MSVVICTTTHTKVNNDLRGMLVYKKNAYKQNQRFIWCLYWSM